MKRGTRNLRSSDFTEYKRKFMIRIKVIVIIISLVDTSNEKQSMILAIYLKVLE